MKTTTALLEYFIPGCLLFFATAIIFVALQQIPPAVVLAVAKQLLKSEGAVQLALGLFVLSGSYGLGAISSNIAGYLVKPFVRAVQKVTIQEYLPFLEERGLLKLGSMKGVNGERVRSLAAYLRALSIQSCPSAAEAMQFHSDQARLLRAFLLPAAVSSLATLVTFAAYGFPNVWLTLVLIASFAVVFGVAADSYRYRQKLLVSTAVDHLLAAKDLGTIGGKASPAKDELIVGVEAGRERSFPISFQVAHRYGVCHLVMHVEVQDEEGRILVWKREDGRLELPGGHVAWGGHGGEEPRYAAARELLEELGVGSEELADRACQLMKVVRIVAWQTNESADGDNREWVGIARVPLAALGAVNMKLAGALSGEKNHDPEWMSIEQVRAYVDAHPDGYNSSIRLLMERSVEPDVPSASTTSPSPGG